MKHLKTLLFVALLMLSASCASNHVAVDTSMWASKQTCQFDPHCTITSIHSHVSFE